MEKEKNQYIETAKKQAPYLSFGIGAGTGTVLTNKFFPSGKKFGKRAAIAGPLIGGALGYIGANKATGKDMDLAERSTLMTLGGGATALGLYHKLRKGKYNQLKSNLIGSAGGLGGAMGSVAMTNAVDKNNDNPNQRSKDLSQEIFKIQKRQSKMTGSNNSGDYKDKIVAIRKDWS